MSVGARRLAGVVGASAAAVAGALLVANATAVAPAAGLTFSVKVPPAGSLSWLFVRLEGTLGPGAKLPAQVDLRQLAAVENAAALPTGLAVYAAVRVGRSGSRIAIRELIVVLNPRTAKIRKTASATQAAPQAGTVQVDEFPQSPKDLIALGSRIKWGLEVREGYDFDRWAALILSALDPAGAPAALESPDPLIPPSPSLVAGITPADLGSWEDGHAFGWKVNGSSAKAAAVFNDVDAITSEIRRLVNPTDEERAFIEASLKAETARLAEAASLPPGALDLTPPASSGTAAAGTASTPSSGKGSSGASTSTTPSTTGTASGANPALMVVYNEAGFEGDPCFPGGRFKVSWQIHGARPGAKLVVALTGPNLNQHDTLTLTENGVASASYAISGSGTWRSQIVSVDGQTPSGDLSNEATENPCP
jgi:hypothetical protein